MWHVPGLENPAAHACSRLTPQHLMDVKSATCTRAFVVPLVENWVSSGGERVEEFLHVVEDSFSHKEVWPEPYDHLYMWLRTGRSVGQDPDVGIDAETAVQFNTEPVDEPEELESLPRPRINTSSQARLDDAGNEIPGTSTDTDDLPEGDKHRPLSSYLWQRTSICPDLDRVGWLSTSPEGYTAANILTQGTPSSLKGTNRRIHRHYQCKNLTSTAVCAAAHPEDPRTGHIYEIAVRSPTARHQL